MNTGEVLLKITQGCPAFEDHRISFDGTQPSPEGEEFNLYSITMNKPGSHASLLIRPAMPSAMAEDEATWTTLIEAMVEEFNKYA
jgi:hypothetical protein